MINKGLPVEFAGSGAVSSYLGRSPLQWLRFAAMILLYKFLLDLSYQYVAYAYSYQNFFYDDRTIWTQVLSWMMLICALPAIKTVFEDKSASGNVISLLILFSVIPSITAIGFRSDYNSSYIILMSVFWVILYFTWLLIKPIYLRSASRLESRTFYGVTALILSGAVLTYSYINTGFRLHFDLIGVYDIRAEARGFVAPFPLNYLVSFADNILPVLAIYFFAKGKRILPLALLFVIFVNFSITGTKQLLFVPVLGFIGYFFLAGFGKANYLIIGAIALAGLCLLESLALGSNTLTSLFTYRVLFIPTELHFSYFDYFQSHDFLIYSQSILKLFSDSTQENIQFLIGEYAIGEYTARANNGLFSDAYMNLGVIGVMVHPVLLAIFVRILDGAILGLPQRMAFVVVLYVAFVLVGMTLTAALFTSGLLFLILLLYSLPRDRVRIVKNPLATASGHALG
jgi:hypothetical protein